jgi:hypothetical protein
MESLKHNDIDHVENKKWPPAQNICQLTRTQSMLCCQVPPPMKCLQAVTQFQCQLAAAAHDICMSTIMCLPCINSKPSLLHIKQETHCTLLNNNNPVVLKQQDLEWWKNKQFQGKHDGLNLTPG